MFAQRVASVTGNWSNTATWGGAAVPTSAETVTINAGITVTVDIAASCASLTFNGGTTSSTVTISGTNSLLVVGSITMNAKTANGTSNTLAVGAGTLTAASLSMANSTANTRDCLLSLSTGTVTINGDVTMAGVFARNHIDMTGSATINIGGNVNNGAGAVGGGFTTPPATSTINLNGTSAQTVFLYGGASALGIVEINNTAGVTSGSTMTLTTLNIGNDTANSVFNDGGFQVTSTGTLNLTSGTFKLGSATAATTFPAFTAGRNITAGTTVEYASGVAQTVSIAPSYSNLTFSGAGTKTTAAGTLSIGNNWTVGSTTALNTNNTTVSLTGSLIKTGNVTQGTGAINIGGSWTNNGGTFTAGSGGVIFSGASVDSINGSTATTFTNLTVNQAAGLVNTGTTTTVTGTLTLTSGMFTLSSGLTMGTGATIVRADGSLSTAPTFGTTVNLQYTNTSPITPGPEMPSSASVLSNLTINSTSEVDLAANIQVNGNLAVTAGVFDIGTFTANRTAVGGTLSEGAGAVLRIGGTNGYPANYTTNTLNAASTVEYYGTSQTVSNTPIYGNLLLTGSGTKSTPSGTTTTTVAGSLTVNSGVSYEEAPGATSTLTLNGITNSIAGTLGSVANPFSTINIGNGAGDLFTITSTGTMNAGTVAIGNAAITVTNNGTVTISGNLTGGGASATWVNAANSTLNVGGTLLATGVLTATASPNTVNYYSVTGITSVKGTTYDNLIYNKPGDTELTSTNITVNSDLTVSAGTLQFGAFTTVVTGSTYISGSLSITSATGTKTFGDIVVNPGGTFTNTTEAVTVNGNLHNDGTFTPGTGVYTLAGASKTIDGANNFAIPSVTVTGTYTNNDTLTVATALSGTGGLTNGTNALLNVGGTSAITTLTATANGNSVNFTGAAQTVHTGDYYNLTLSGSGTKTLQTGTVNIGGDLTLSGTASTTAVAGLAIGGSVTLGSGTTFTAGAFTHSVGGDWTNNGGTFTSTGSTVSFDGSGVQNINGSVGSQTFNNLEVNKSSGALSVAGSTTTIALNGSLTMTAGTFNSPSSMSITGAVLLNGGTWNAGSVTSLAGNWTNNSGVSAFNAGTGYVTFTGSAAQTIGGTQSTTFDTLVVSKSAKANQITLGQTITLSGNLSIVTGTLADSGYQITGNTLGSVWLYGNGVLSLGSFNTPTLFPTNYITVNTHLLPASTVTYVSSQNQTVSGVPTYGILSLAGSGIKSLNAPLNLLGGLNIGANVTLDDKGYQISGNAGTPMTMGANATLILGSAGSATVFPTGFTSSDVTLTAPSTIVYNSNQSQTIATVPTYRILSLASTSPATKTAAGPITADSLTIGSFSTLADGGNTVTVNGDVTNNGAHTGSGKILLSGTIEHLLAGNGSYTKLQLNNTTNGATLTGSPTVGDSLVLTTGNFTVGANTLTLNGPPLDSLQTRLVATAASSFVFGGAEDTLYLPKSITALNNLNVNMHTTDSKLNHAAPLTVNGVLTLTQGILDLFWYPNPPSRVDTVTIPSGASVNIIGGRVKAVVKRWVPVNAGTQTISWPIGGADVKTQVDITFSNVSTAGYLAFRMFANDHPQINSSGINPSESVNRYWQAANYGVAFSSANLTFGYAGTSDIDAGANWNNFIVSGYNGGTWTVLTTGTRTSTSTQATGVTSLGAFQIGEPGEKIWTGAGDGTSWGNASNWSPTGVPGSIDAVKIRSAASISITTAAAAGSLVLNNSGLTLTIATSGSLAVTSDLTDSTGTLNTQVSFPTVGGVVTLVGGSVGYTASGAQNVSSQSYNDLALSGSGAKTFSGTTSIAGNFTIGGTATAATTGSTVILNGTAAQSVAATTYNNLTVNGTGPMTLSAGTTTIGGTLTLTAGALDVNTQTLVLNSTVLQTSGSLTSQASGLVNYAQGSAGQSVIAASYGNLTFSNFNKTLASSGSIGIAGTFTPGTATGHTITGSTFDFNGTGAQTVPAFNYNNLTISGNRGGLAVTMANGTIGIAGTFNPTATNLTYSMTGDTVSFNGTSPQTVPAFTYLNQSVSNATGLTLTGVDSVTGVLSFPGAGIITTGAYKVVLGTGGSINRSGTGFVDGFLQKYIPTGSNVAATFEIGRGTTYTPITGVLFASVSAAGNIIASDSSIEHPQIGSSTIDPTKSANRFWTLSAGSPVPVFTNYSAVFNFVPGDLDAGANTANFIVSRYSASVWTPPTTGTTTTTSTQATGITGLGDFAVGQPAGAVPKTWVGPTTGNWSVGTNWNPGGAPTSADNVNLTAADTITIDVAATCNTIALGNSSLVLIVAPSMSLTVSGNLIMNSGKLILQNLGGAFPAVTGSVTLAGGTVSYAGAGAQTVSTQSYYNLDFAGSGTKTISGTTNIAGDLTIGGSATATTTGSTIVFNGTGAQAIAPITYENLTINGSGTKSLATGTTTVNSTLSLSAGTFDVNTQTLVLNSSVNQTSGTLTSQPTGTVQYTQGSDGQTVIATGSYGNLTFNNFNKVLASSGTIGISGAFTPGTATGHTITGSTINFNGAGAQTVPAFSYNNLAVSGTRTTSNVTLSGTINIAGDFTNSASFTSGGYVTSGSTVNYNGTGSQAVAPINYDALTFSSSGTRVLASGSTTGIGSTLTLSGGSVTSTGSTVNFNGASQSVASLTYNNLTLSGSGTKTFAASTVTINGDFTVSGVTVNPNGGTVTFNNTSGSQAVAATTYNNLVLSGNSTKVLASGSTTFIGGNFTVSGGAVTTTGSTVEFNASSGSQSVAAINYNNLTFSNAGQRVLSAGTTGIAGSLTPNAGTIDVQTNSSLVQYNGSSVQTIAPITYWDLTTNNASGFNLNSGNITVNDILALQSGIITTGANAVVINGTSAISRTSGHVVGNLRYFIDNIGSPARTFTVGDAGTYAPVFIQFANVTTTGFVTVSTTAGDHPQLNSSNIDGTKSVNRYWTLTNSGVVFDPAGYTATFTFVSGDVDGGANTANFIVGAYNAGWTYPTVGTKASTSTQITGQNSFGDFAIGEASAFVPKTWDGGAGTNNWGDAANWNPDGVPTASNNVTLSAASATTIRVNVNANANSLSIGSNITLNIPAANTLTAAAAFSMSAGTVNDSSAFPSAASYSFTGGTFGYTGAAQTVSTQSYYGLNLAGSGAKTFSGTTNIAGDFTIGGTATATTTGTTIVFNGSGAQAVAATTYENLTINGTGTKTLASGTTTVNSTLTLTTGTLDVTTQTLVLNSTTVQTSGSLSSQASGTVNYAQGSAGQAVLAGSYGSLTFSNFNKTLASSGTIGIAGTFTTGSATGHTVSGSTIDFDGTGAQTIPAFSYGNLTISGARTTNSVTLVNGTTMNIAGDFTVTATFSSGGFVTTNNTVNFNGSSPQNASGFRYNNQTINNSSGLTISGVDSVTGVLSLAAGNITTGSSRVALGTAGALTRAGGGFIIGNLQRNFATGATVRRFFEVGTGSSFAPVYVTMTTVGTAGNLIVSSTAGDHPSVAGSNVDGNKSINRYWTLTNGGITVASYTANFHWVPADTDNGVNQGQSVIAQRFSASTWNNTTIGTKYLDSTLVTGLTGYGDFQIGVAKIAPAITWDGGAGSNRWADAGNWNPDGVPTSASDVNLTGANAIIIDTVAVCNSLTLNNGGLTVTLDSTLTITTQFTISNGVFNTLRSFPTAGAVSITGGTVGYTQNGTQTVSSQSYFNLNLGGSGAKTFPATVNVAGDLTISGTATLAPNSGTVNFNGGGAQSIGATTYYNLSLINIGTKTFATGTTSISGAFSVSGGATPNATSFATAILYNGTIAQTVLAMAYDTLSVSNSGTRTLGAGSISVQSDLHVLGGSLDIGTSTLNRNTSGGTLLVSSGATLKVGGSSGGLSGSNFPSNFSTMTLNGIVEFNGSVSQTIPALQYTDLTSSSSGTRTLSNGGTIGVAGVFTAGSNSYTITGSTVDFNGSGGQTIPSFAYNNISLSTSGTKAFSSGSTGIAGTLAINGSAAADATTNSATINYNGGTQTITGIAYSGLTLSNAGTKTFPSGTTHIAGPFTISGATADATTNTTTIDFNGAGSQNVAGITFNNLSFSNAGTKTFLAGTSTIMGNFAISGSATGDATTNSTTITYGGTNQSVATIGYYNLTLSNSGTKTFAAGSTGIAGTFTVSGAATPDVVTNSSTIDYNGAGSQNVLAMDYYSLSLSNAGTKTFSGTTRIAASLTLAGSAAADATTNSSTIEYNGANPQSVAGVTYYNLTFTNGGLKTIGAATSVNGTTLINAGANLLITNTLQVTGDMLNDGFITNNGTIIAN